MKNEDKRRKGKRMRGRNGDDKMLLNGGKDHD
jgi:hypothetical protein